MSWLIYRHKCLITNESYIGQTKCSAEERWEEHCWCAFHNSKLHFHKAIKKYSPENFEHEVLEDNIQTIEEANIAEQYWIDWYDTFKSGYNATSGGKQCEISEETKRKLSKSHKGKKFSEEHKRNLSKSQIGRKHSEKTKKKMSESKKGVYPKSFRSKKGIKLSQDHKTKIAKNNPRSQSVNQFDLNTNKLIATYYSFREASYQTGINRNMISESCKGNEKYLYVGGYKWSLDSWKE